MPYLELHNIDTLLAEAADQKVKEIRCAGFMSEVPDAQLGSVSTFRLTLSFLCSDGVVIRYTEFIGTCRTDKEDCEALQKATIEREALLKASFAKRKIALKSGEYKF
jgi:hypothetical protein